MLRRGGAEGIALGVHGAIAPLVIGAAHFHDRPVETGLREVGRGHHGIYLLHHQGRCDGLRWTG